MKSILKLLFMVISFLIGFILTNYLFGIISKPVDTVYILASIILIITVWVLEFKLFVKLFLNK
jgi:hypothetical protein